MGHSGKPAAAANLQVCCRPEGLLLWPGLQEISIDCCTALSSAAANAGTAALAVSA